MLNKNLFLFFHDLLELAHTCRVLFMESLLKYDHHPKNISVLLILVLLESAPSCALKNVEAVLVLPLKLHVPGSRTSV